MIFGRAIRLGIAAGVGLMGRRSVEVDCVVEIEQNSRYFQAHAVPENIDLRPGDTVLVHDAPGSIAFGQSLTVARRATVTRAGLLTRCWVRFTSLFALADLFEVGFESRELS
jgi:hypothetical protein